LLQHVSNKEVNPLAIAVGQASSRALSAFNALDPVCFFGPEHELEEGIVIKYRCQKLTGMTPQGMIKTK